MRSLSDSDKLIPEGTRLHFCPCVRRAKSKVAASFVTGCSNLLPAYDDLVFRVPLSVNIKNGYPNGYPQRYRKMVHSPQSYRLSPVIHGLSHGLKKCPPDTFLHQSADWCRPFESLPLCINKRRSGLYHPLRLLLVRRKGLEPPTY